MPRQSRRQEILEALWLRDEQSSAELAHVFPRKTLYRHLKQLCREGLVKKEPAARREGRRGRQPVTYKLNAQPFETFPTKWLGGEWFPGVRIQEGHRARRIGDFGRESHVRLSGQEKKDYEEKKRQLKNPLTPDPRILEEKRRRRDEIVRKALEGSSPAVGS